jgi:hypothetical protein
MSHPLKGALSLGSYSNRLLRILQRPVYHVVRSSALLSSRALARIFSMISRYPLKHKFIRLYCCPMTGAPAREKFKVYDSSVSSIATRTMSPWAKTIDLAR